MLITVAFTALGVACFAAARALLDSLTLKRELDRLTKELESLRRAAGLRSQLANEIAHDIKNPLTAIVCSAEALDLLLGSKLEDCHRESLRYVREYGSSLLQLMNDFIDVNRAESGLLKTNPEIVDVQKVAASVVGLLDAFAERRGVALRTNCGSVALCALIDPKHLKQIIFNLVHNAIKFTHSGGEVSVELSPSSADAYVTIRICDNGKGISPEFISKIFDPYQCVGNGEAQYDAGVGLGLALCKQLVTLAGGSIEVQSELGVGSIFSFSVPAAQAPQKLSERPIIEGDLKAPPLSGQRVLVVDTDGGSREAVSRLIEAWGGVADRVAEAADAIEALSRSEYHAVVIDGERDPVAVEELARVVKQDLRQDTTIILSACARDSQPPLSNIDRVVTKPFLGDDLLASLLSVNAQKLH